MPLLWSQPAQSHLLMAAKVHGPSQVSRGAMCLGPRQHEQLLLHCWLWMPRLLSVWCNLPFAAAGARLLEVVNLLRKRPSLKPSGLL